MKYAIAGLMFMLAGTGVHAQTQQWPAASAPCNTTLQQCVLLVPSGTTVWIATAIPVDEDVVIRTPALTLAAYPDTLASFAPGRVVEVNTDAAVPATSVTLDSLGFGANGGIVVDHRGTGTASILIRRTRLRDAGDRSAISLRATASSGPMSTTISETDIDVASGQWLVAPIRVRREGGSQLFTRLQFNRILSPQSPGSGLRAMDVACDASDCTLDAFANEVRGGFDSAISLNAAGVGTISSLVMNNLVAGQRPGGQNLYAIDVFAPQKSGQVRVVANTVVDNATGVRLTLPANATGDVYDNLFARNGAALCVSASAVSDERNLFSGNTNDFGAGVCGAPAGANSVFADPRFTADGSYRLRADSPAIGAGSIVAFETEAVARNLPRVDLDGLRRLRGAAMDLGAYEHGDVMALHTVTAAAQLSEVTGLPISAATHMPLHGGLVNPFGGGGVVNGIFTVLSPLCSGPGVCSFFLRAATGQQIAAGSSEAVWIPEPGNGSAFHTNDGSNTVGAVATTALAASPVGLDLLFANPYGTPTALCTSTASGFWQVRRADGSAITQNGVDDAFYVYRQDRSPAAVVHITSFQNTLFSGSQIRHPLLDNRRCARPLVAPITCDNAHPIGMNYVGPFWEVRNLDGAPMEFNRRFAVLVDRRQVDRDCGDGRFADSFE